MTITAKSGLIRSKILEMHKAGLTIQAMAEKLSITKNAVHYHRSAMGIRRYNGKLSCETRNTIFKMKGDGLTSNEIAIRLNLHKSSVNRVLKKVRHQHSLIQRHDDQSS